MKLKTDFEKLRIIAEQFNPSPVDDELLKGKEIPLQEVNFTNGLISYKGRQVLLYIKDHTGRLNETIIDPKNGNRFHIAHCSMLEKMYRQNRFERYVATNQLTGIFSIEDSVGRGNVRKVDTPLLVCKLCLSRLNYKGYARLWLPKKSKVFREFSIDEFFSEYSSYFKHLPKSWDEKVKS